MQAVRPSRSLIVAIALVMSLGANVMLFVGGVVYSVVDEFVDGAFGLATAAATQRRALAALKTASAKQAKALATSKAVAARQRGELSTLRGVAATQRREIAALKTLSAKLRREIATLRADAVRQGKALNALHSDSVRQGRNLAALRATNGKLGGALAASRAVAARQSQELAELRTKNGAIGPAAKRSRDRLAKSIGRSILTAPGKALPYAGIPIVIGLTAWEIKDLCDTIRDMNEIQTAARAPEAEVESEPIVCERPDLAVERAVAKLESYSRKKWDEYKKYVPDLPGWEDIPASLRDAWRSAVPDSLRDMSPGIWDRMKGLWGGPLGLVGE